MKIILLRSIGLIFSILLALVLVRGLPTRHYADFAVLYSIVTVGGTVFSFGVPQSIAAGIINSKDENEAIELIRAAILFVALSFLVIAAIGVKVFLFQKIFTSYSNLFTANRVGSAVFGVWALVLEKTVADIFRGEGRSLLYSIAGGPISAMVSVLTVSALLHFGVQKETEIVQCIAGCTILSSLVIAITCNKRIAFNLRWAFSGYIVKRVRGLVMASGYNWFFESTVWVRAQCDIWLVAGLLQPENVRDYSVGLRIASATIIPTSTLSLAASAKYGMVKNSVESIVSCINTLRIQTLYIGLSVLILLWIIGGRVISSILHFNGGDAIWITHVLSLGLFICILIGPGNQLLQINQCERVLARTTLIALLIHIPAAAIAGSIFGVYGVVFESVLLYILQNVLVARNVKSCLKIRLLSIRAA